jgi:hypothetical protein
LEQQLSLSQAGDPHMASWCASDCQPYYAAPSMEPYSMKDLSDFSSGGLQGVDAIEGNNLLAAPMKPWGQSTVSQSGGGQATHARVSKAEKQFAMKEAELFAMSAGDPMLQERLEQERRFQRAALQRTGGAALAAAGHDRLAPSLAAFPLDAVEETRLNAPYPETAQLSRRSGRGGGSRKVSKHQAGIAGVLAGTSTETMKTQLQALQLEDPGSVFIARRINKLGFSSAEQLRSYFSRYGEVKGVYVSHSRVRCVRPMGRHVPEPESHWRLRAAALGFVVMESPEATRGILADSEHVIHNCMIKVYAFHRRSCAEMGEEGMGSDMEDNEMSQQGSLQQLPPLGPDQDGNFPQFEQRQNWQHQAAFNGGFPGADPADASADWRVKFLFGGGATCTEEDLRYAMPDQYED